MAHTRRRQTRETSEIEGPRLSQRHLLILGLAIVVALSLVFLSQSWRWVAAYNELQKAQTQLEAAKAEHRRTQFEVERAFSLERIERIAEEQLNMSRPEELRYLERSASDSDPP
ncbi:MAG: cell division protein FtsL [Candidatus Bipolaricaulia bacterium]